MGVEMEPLYIYVAGPYTPKTDDIHDAARLAHQNVQRAVRIGASLIEKGHYPHIPHFLHYMYIEMDHHLLPEFWYKYDMAWLKKCDALFYVGSSKGADVEKAWAEAHRLRVFTRLEDVPTSRIAGVELRRQGSLRTMVQG